MPYYMTQAKYSKDAVQALLANPQDRGAVVSKLFEAIGGKLHHCFFAFGEDDIVVLYEAPDNTSAAAAILAVAGSGSLSAAKTTVLMTMDEAVAAMKKGGAVSGTYKPPSG
ncbi:MAG: GYD domain-containing protein [Pseudomonadota bacterium]